MKNTIYLFAIFSIFLVLSCGDDDASIIDPPMQEPEPSSLSNGVLFHVPFAGNANDVSSAGLAGTVIGATIVPDRHDVLNEAYLFNGEGDYVDYGGAPALGLGGTVPYTMCSWVKPTLQDTIRTGMIVSKFNGGVAAGWYMAVNTNSQKLQVARNVAPWANFGQDTITIGEYVHLATTYDGSSLITYINGERDNTVPFRSHPNDTRTRVLIGSRFLNSVPGAYFKGVIDDVRIWDRVLTQEELTWLATH